MPESSLILTTEQQLRLSQVQIQRLEMLGLSAEALSEKIQKEAEKNPFLEVRNPIISLDGEKGEHKERTFDYGQSLKDELDSNDESEEHDHWFERTLAVPETLSEHIVKEVSFLDISDDMKNAVIMLSTALDRDGFLKFEAEDVLKEHKELADGALKILQNLDPVGLGARDVKESLSLQAKALSLPEEEEKKLLYVINNLELLKNGKTDLIEKRLSITREEANELIKALKTLNPYPGREYEYTFEEYVYPEISIKKNDEGELIIHDHSDQLPAVSLNAEYMDFEKELKSKKEKDRAALEYLKENKERAENLIHAITLRKDSLERISYYLISKQRAFFDKGPLYLVPDTQQQAADAMGLSISTVSRICSDKFIDTDYGIFPFSYFFSSSSGFSKDDENAKSKNAIKERIRQIIGENSGQKALSDQKITDILNSEGIKCARRTVAKYRSELKLESSYTRNT